MMTARKEKATLDEKVTLENNAKFFMQNEFLKNG